MSATLTAAARQDRLRRPTLYIALSILMAAIALVGFGPGYVDALAHGIARPPILHIHAAVFTGWLALFAAQAVLAAKGKIRWHLALGRLGIAYGVALVLVGVYTTVVRAAALPAGGEVLLYVALLDMVLFACFFGAAIWYRGKPEIHKRLMTVAAASLLIAAVARMDFLPGPPLGPFVRFLLWSTPIAIAMTFDLRRKGSVHPVYWIGLLAFATRVWSVPLSRTAEWRELAQWVYGLGL